MTFIKQKPLILNTFRLIVLAASLFFQGALYAADMQGVQPSSSRGSVKSMVLFTARDSVIYNLGSRSMELWGEATIDHEGASVKAPKIVLDVDSSLLHAFGATDPAKKLSEPALFRDKQGSFSAEAMSYNFLTKRGETTRVSSSSNGIKFTGGQVSRLENGEMIVHDGDLTTCNEPDPHYWFSSSSMVFSPDKGVTARPLIMYIRPEIFSKRLPAIPILVLPYMFFPIKQGRSSGFLTPHLAMYGGSSSLSSLGYFWAINDYADLRTEGDVALNGSWRLGERFRYVKRDAFSGEIGGEYKRYVDGYGGQHFTDWNASIVHNQIVDPSAKLDVNFRFQGGERHDDLNTMNFGTILTEQTNSALSLAKTFNDENAFVDLTYNRSHDLRNQNDRQSVGSTFYQNRIYPFRPDFSALHDGWQSDISVTTGASLTGESVSQVNGSSSGYLLHANGELGLYREFTDGYKALFTQGIAFQSMQPLPAYNSNTYSGMRVFFPLRMQSTLFHHFNINPGITYSRSLRTDGEDFSATVLSVDASTRLYGTIETGFLENVLGLKALRHIFIPVISYTWNPAFSGIGYNAGKVYDWGDSRFFVPLEITRDAGVPAGQSTVGITLKNLFQGRFIGSLLQGEEDSSAGVHTDQLLSVTASTSCNAAADAFRLAPLTIISSSNLLAPNFFFSSGAMYDFYSYDPLTGERVNRSNREDGRGMLRFIKGFLNMSLSIQSDKQTGSTASYASTFAVPFASNVEQALFREPFNTREWQLRFSLFLQEDRSNALETVHDRLLNMAAKVALSKNWQTGVTTGYNFENKRFVFPMLQVYRDLHCWQVGFQWVPSGAFKSYAVQIGLKTL